MIGTIYIKGNVDNTKEKIFFAKSLRGLTFARQATKMSTSRKPAKGKVKAKPTPPPPPAKADFQCINLRRLAQKMPSETNLYPRLWEFTKGRNRNCTPESLRNLRDILVKEAALIVAEIDAALAEKPA